MDKVCDSLTREADDYVRVWTAQPLTVWERLQETGTLLVDPALCEQLHDWRDSYEWMCRQMQSRLPGCEGRFPWWGWHRYNVRRPMPHINWLRRHRDAPGPHVRIELRMPKERVLLSSLPGWEEVINHWHISYTMKEALDWCDAEEDAGLGTVYWPYPEPWRHRIEESWPRIFDLEGLDRGDCLPQSRIQATFEVLDLQYVVKADAYTAI